MVFVCFRVSLASGCCAFLTRRLVRVFLRSCRNPSLRLVSKFDANAELLTWQAQFSALLVRRRLRAKNFCGRIQYFGSRDNPSGGADRKLREFLQILGLTPYLFSFDSYRAKKLTNEEQTPSILLPDPPIEASKGRKNRSDNDNPKIPYFLAILHHR